ELKPGPIKQTKQEQAAQMLKQQEQLKQEQLKQEQLKQEQLKQEQLKQEQQEPEKQQREKTRSDASKVEPPTRWTKLWSVPIGASAGSGYDGDNAIVTRGSLILVASVGVVDESDAADGVYLVSGQQDLPQKDRRILHIPSPISRGSGSTDP